jgi:hypothetical protein
MQGPGVAEAAAALRNGKPWAVFLRTQTGEPTGRYNPRSWQRSSGDFWQRVSLDLLDAFACLLTVQEVARQFEFNSLRRASPRERTPERSA